jgi:hypothetical protein
MANTWPSIILMAKRSSNLAVRLFIRALAACLAIAAAPAAGTAAGCPFCTPLEPTLCQWRARAAVTALAEVEGTPAVGTTTLKLHRVFDRADSVGNQTHLTVELDLTARPGTLLLIFGIGADDAALEALAWHAVAVNEISYAYFARSPAARAPAADRLTYFARFLEHPDSAVAEDAYLEFARAPFDDVAQVAEQLPIARARGWLVDPGVPSHRKGFYGLALGLERDAHQRRANSELLRKLILAPEDDFRSGFDGILGGYLLLEGTPGLDLVESRYLADSRAADIDVRHAMMAVRFCHEYGREIPEARLHAAVRHLLARPEFAEAAITDLARWKDWDALDEIVALYARPRYAQPATGRAIVGYLLACPGAKAAAALERLRKLDPPGVAAAEQILSRIGSVPRND